MLVNKKKKACDLQLSDKVDSETKTPLEKEKVK